MPCPSRVDRLGLVSALDQLVTSGATVDEITDALNRALARADRPDRLSRAAVGRARKTRLGVLEAKRHADDVLHTLADAGSAAGLEGRLELMRMLLTSTAARTTDDPEAPPRPIRTSCGRWPPRFSPWRKRAISPTSGTRRPRRAPGPRPPPAANRRPGPRGSARRRRRRSAPRSRGRTRTPPRHDGTADAPAVSDALGARPVRRGRHREEPAHRDLVGDRLRRGPARRRGQRPRVLSVV